MSIQTFSASHPLTPTLWSDGLEAESLKKISYTGLIGTRNDSLIQWKDGLSSKPGNSETIGLRMQLANAPKTSGQAVETNEQTLQLYDQSITIDEVVDAVKFGNVMDRQRVNFDMRDEAKAALADQLSNAWDVSLFNQLAGFHITGMAQTFHGNNPVTAPTSNNHVIAAGRADEASLTSADGFLLDYISWCVEKAKTMSPSIRPARIKGFNQPLYVMFIHPYAKTQLSVQDSRWDKVQMAALQGGLINGNPLVTGALGVWDGCLICESNRVPMGIDGSGNPIPTVRRAIFCGAQAGLMAWGRMGGDPKRFRWVEKQFDFDREYGVMGGFLGGIVKSNFNSNDFATIVVSHYATASA